jgi:D-xylose transport system substrate-binding protein
MAIENSKVNVVALNAEDSQDTQNKQADIAIAAGVKVLVVSPVLPTGATQIVQDARAHHVPVIALDVAIPVRGLDLYAGYNSYQAGRLQRQYILHHLKKHSYLLFMNGSANDPRDEEQLRGVYDPILHDFRSAGYWPLQSPTQSAAQGQMTQILRGPKKPLIQGIVAVNDEVAGGVIWVLRKYKYRGNPTIVGRGASLLGAYNVLIGREAMTVYKPVKREAAIAADAANAFLARKPAPAAFRQRYRLEDQQGTVKAALLTQIRVTRANLGSTVIKDKFVSRAALCRNAWKLCRQFHI